MSSQTTSAMSGKRIADAVVHGEPGVDVRPRPPVKKSPAPIGWRVSRAAKASGAPTRNARSAVVRVIGSPEGSWAREPPAPARGRARGRAGVPPRDFGGRGCGQPHLGTRRRARVRMAAWRRPPAPPGLAPPERGRMLGIAAAGLAAGLAAEALVLASDHFGDRARVGGVRAAGRLELHRHGAVRLAAPAGVPLRRAHDPARLRVVPRGARGGGRAAALHARAAARRAAGARSWPTPCSASRPAGSRPAVSARSSRAAYVIVPLAPVPALLVSRVRGRRRVRRRVPAQPAPGRARRGARARRCSPPDPPS